MPRYFEIAAGLFIGLVLGNQLPAGRVQAEADAGLYAAALDQHTRVVEARLRQMDAPQDWRAAHELAARQYRFRTWADTLPTQVRHGLRERGMLPGYAEIARMAHHATVLARTGDSARRSGAVLSWARERARAEGEG